MKKIITSQRIDFISERNEVREGLDTKINLILLKLGYFPLALSNNLGTLSKLEIMNFLDEICPHGILLSGGNDIGEYEKRDTFERTLIEYAIKTRKPLIGICRGMQMIAKYFDVFLDPIDNHVSKKNKISGFIDKEIMCFHRFQLRNCPDNFYILAKSNDGCIEAIRSNKYKMLGIMWHPERGELDLIDQNLIKDFYK